MIKQIIASVTLTVFLLLAMNPLFAVADNIGMQTISANMNGFAFTDGGCCPAVSSTMNGKIMIDADGKITLLQQSGTITIGSTTYQIKLSPNDETTKELVSNECTSSPTYQQNGEISVIGNNGTVFKGSGVYSWGSFPSCSSDKNSFANFSGNIKDSTGKQIEFYAGTDSLPSIQ